VNENNSNIWRLQAQFDIQGLIDALKEEETNIRRRAAAALRAIGDKKAVPAIRVALINEQDPEVRAILASALDTLSDTNEEVLTKDIEQPESLVQVQKLIDMLNSDEPEQVIDAAHQLGELGDQIAVEPLVLIFNDMKSSMQVKLAVAEALLKLEGAPVEVALLAALRHNDWHIRRNGAAILGQLKAEWAVEPLSKAMRDPHSTVRRTARAALQNINTPEAISALNSRPEITSQPTSKKPRSKPITDVNETIPAAPRDGLLNRLRAQQQAYEMDESASEEVAGHLRPTKPLDPEVLKQLKQHEDELLSEEARSKEENDD